MNDDLEKKVKSHLVCQTHQKMPPETPMHLWEWPEKPVHVDHAGPVLGKMLLVLVDAQSK